MSAVTLELRLNENELLDAFRRLPPQRRTELIEKLQALSSPTVRTVPATKLYALTGIVSLGGDAVIDTEAIYDDDSDH